MNKYFASALLFVTTASTAQASVPIGTFGHGFTKSKDTPVWTVTPRAQGFSLVSHGDGRKTVAHVLTISEREKFWHAMSWGANLHMNSECIGGKTELICYVPASTRQSIPDLQSQDSDFFHFDKMGGIMEIKKIDKR